MLEKIKELEDEVVVESVLDEVSVLELRGEAAPTAPSRLEVVVLLIVLFADTTLELDEEVVDSKLLGLVVVMSEELDDDEVDVELVGPPFELVPLAEAVVLLLEISCPVISLFIVRRAKLTISSNTGEASVVQKQL